eukprot:270373_1
MRRIPCYNKLLNSSANKPIKPSNAIVPTASNVPNISKPTTAVPKPKPNLSETAPIAFDQLNDGFPSTINPFSSTNPLSNINPFYLPDPDNPPLAHQYFNSLPNNSTNGVIIIPNCRDSL